MQIKDKNIQKTWKYLKYCSMKWGKGRRIKKKYDKKRIKNIKFVFTAGRF